MQNIFQEFVQSAEQLFFLGSNLKQWIIALVVFLGTVVFFKIVFWIIFRQLNKMAEKTVNDIDDFAVALAQGIKPPFYYIVSFYIATRFLNIEDTFGQIIFAIFIIVTVLQAIFVLLKIVDFVISRETKKSSKEDKSSRRTILQFLGQIIKGAIWIIGHIVPNGT